MLSRVRNFSLPASVTGLRTVTITSLAQSSGRLTVAIATSIS